MRSLNIRSGTARPRARFLAVCTAFAAVVMFVSTASAHDFWLIPHLFAFSDDSMVHVNCKSGVQFPKGAPVQPTRVASAWVIGANARTQITQLAVVDSSLLLHHKPGASGQYLIAVALTPRTSRSTPAGLLRYLRAEGGGAEATRLERENALVGDSLVFHGASYAATVVQVGRAGARAFSLTAGFPLEFVPLSDPAHLHVGDTLRVRVLGGGKAARGIGIDARNAADSVGTENPWTTLNADANGVVHLALSKPGPWLIRSAWVGKRAGGASNEWDVARSTYVFDVATRH